MKLKQRVVDGVMAQFRHPTGLGGRAAGLVIAHRSSNRRRNSWAASLLDVQPDERVLEIGFGPGLNAQGIERGVVDLRLASVDDLPAFDEPFDKILAVNAMLFWRDSVARLENLRRLLRGGGVIAVAHQPRGPGASDATAAREGREMEAALADAGFSEVRLETLALKPAVVCALGVNGPQVDGAG
jgi:SAM-dependent methyltransferase